MKLYLVSPNLDGYTSREAVAARHMECMEPIVELIYLHVSIDPALFGVRSKREVGAPPVPTDLSFGDAEAVHLVNAQLLRKILSDSANPYIGNNMLIRSLVTCRAVYFGYDGQAFVCLPTDAKPIISPDPDLVVVEECSHHLIESDWLDGLLDH